MSRIDKKRLSELDICTKFITPALTLAKWDLMNQIREEVSFTKGRVIVRGKLSTRGEPKRADYLLYHKPGIPPGHHRGQRQSPLRRRRYQPLQSSSSSSSSSSSNNSLSGSPPDSSVSDQTDPVSLLREFAIADPRGKEVFDLPAWHRSQDAVNVARMSHPNV
jgi:hypothetical protein